MDVGAARRTAWGRPWRTVRSLTTILADPLFDHEWYRWLHPEAPASRLGAARHYLGASPGSPPSADFDQAEYLRANPDVEASGLDPLVHYRRHGHREGRGFEPVRRRFFAGADGVTDRAALAAFLTGQALRTDRSRAVPALRQLAGSDTALFGALLGLLAAPSEAAAAKAVRMATATRRTAPVRARIIIGDSTDRMAVLATWCSLAADPSVDPAMIDAPSSPGDADVEVRVAAGALVIPGSVGALVAATITSGGPAFGDVLGPDGTNEARWRRPGEPEGRERILSASAAGASGPPTLVASARSILWPALGALDPRPRALVMDQRVPHLDRDSGSMSAVSYLTSLGALGYRVTFVPVDLDFDPVHSVVLESLGIEVVDQRHVASPAEVTASGLFELALLLRPETVADFGGSFRAASPGALLVSVPMDAHFVRLEGAASVLGSSIEAADAERYRRMELANLRLADLTLTGSTDEVALLRALAPGSRVEHLPVARPELPVSALPTAERRDLVFLGGFGHPPNLDGLIWFLDEVWPAIAAELADARLVVYGSELPALLHRRAGDRVVMHGYVEHLADAFRTGRIFVAPLRFGAGYKGKIVSAMSAGLPVVTTGVGAAGMDLETAVVADGAAPFAAAVIALWRDEARLEDLARRTRAEALERFSDEEQRRVLARLLDRPWP